MDNSKKKTFVKGNFKSFKTKLKKVFSDDHQRKQRKARLEDSSSSSSSISDSSSSKKRKPSIKQKKNSADDDSDSSNGKRTKSVLKSKKTLKAGHDSDSSNGKRRKSSSKVSKYLSADRDSDSSNDKKRKSTSKFKKRVSRILPPEDSPSSSPPQYLAPAFMDTLRKIPSHGSSGANSPAKLFGQSPRNTSSKPSSPSAPSVPPRQNGGNSASSSPRLFSLPGQLASPFKCFEHSSHHDSGEEVPTRLSSAPSSPIQPARTSGQIASPFKRFERSSHHDSGEEVPTRLHNGSGPSSPIQPARSASQHSEESHTYSGPSATEVDSTLAEGLATKLKRSSTKLRSEQSAIHDATTGVTKCRHCEWVYANAYPTGRQRRDHRKVCAGILNVQNWLGSEQLGTRSTSSSILEDTKEQALDRKLEELNCLTLSRGEEDVESSTRIPNFEKGKLLTRREAVVAFIHSYASGEGCALDAADMGVQKMDAFQDGEGGSTSILVANASKNDQFRQHDHAKGDQEFPYTDMNDMESLSTGRQEAYSAETSETVEELRAVEIIGLQQCLPLSQVGSSDAQTVIAAIHKIYMPGREVIDSLQLGLSDKIHGEGNEMSSLQMQQPIEQSGNASADVSILTESALSNGWNGSSEEHGFGNRKASNDGEILCSIGESSQETEVERSTASANSGYTLAAGMKVTHSEAKGSSSGQLAATAEPSFDGNGRSCGTSPCQNESDTTCGKFSKQDDQEQLSIFCTSEDVKCTPMTIFKEVSNADNCSHGLSTQSPEMVEDRKTEKDVLDHGEGNSIISEEIQYRDLNGPEKDSQIAITGPMTNPENCKIRNRTDSSTESMLEWKSQEGHVEVTDINRNTEIFSEVESMDFDAPTIATPTDNRTMDCGSEITNNCSPQKSIERPYDGISEECDLERRVSSTNSDRCSSIDSETTAVIIDRKEWERPREKQGMEEEESSLAIPGKTEFLVNNSQGVGVGNMSAVLPPQLERYDIRNVHHFVSSEKEHNRERPEHVLEEEVTSKLSEKIHHVFNRAPTILTETMSAVSIPHIVQLQSESVERISAGSLSDHSLLDKVTESESAERISDDVESNLRMVDLVEHDLPTIPTVELASKCIVGIIDTSESNEQICSSEREAFTNSLTTGIQSDHVIEAHEDSTSSFADRGICGESAEQVFMDGSGRSVMLERTAHTVLNISAPAMTVDGNASSSFEVKNNVIQWQEESTHSKYQVEQVLREQSTHDLMCPVCGSCITKRVILRKRKRTLVLETTRQTRVREDTEDLLHEQAQQGEAVLDDAEDEPWGCLACFALFFRRVRTVRQAYYSSSSAVEVLPEREELFTEMLSDTVVQTGDIEDSEEDSKEILDYRCLPLLFPAFSWGTASKRGIVNPDLKYLLQYHTDDDDDGPSDLVQPLLDDATSDAATSTVSSVERKHEQVLSNLDLHWEHPALQETEELPVSTQDLEADFAVKEKSEELATREPLEKAGFNCLPQLVSTISWRTFGVRQHAYLTVKGDGLQESGKHDIVENVELETVQGVVQHVQQQDKVSSEELAESNNLNCLPALLPTFSWGPSVKKLDHEYVITGVEFVDSLDGRALSSEAMTQGQQESKQPVEEGFPDENVISMDIDKVESQSRQSTLIEESVGILGEVSEIHSARGQEGLQVVNTVAYFAESSKLVDKQDIWSKFNTNEIRQFGERLGEEQAIKNDMSLSLPRPQKTLIVTQQSVPKETVEIASQMGTVDAVPMGNIGQPLNNSLSVEAPEIDGQSQDSIGREDIFGKLTEERVSCTEFVEKPDFSCLPKLLPPFSWGSSLIIENSLGQDQVAKAVDKVNEVVGLTEQEGIVEKIVEKQHIRDKTETADLNCLPAVLPTFSWGLPGKKWKEESTGAESEESTSSVESGRLQHGWAQPLAEGSDLLLPVKGIAVTFPVTIEALETSISWAPAEELNSEPLDLKRPSDVVLGTGEETTKMQLDQKLDKAGLNCIPALLPTFLWQPYMKSEAAAEQIGTPVAVKELHDASEVQTLQCHSSTEQLAVAQALINSSAGSEADTLGERSEMSSEQGHIVKETYKWFSNKDGVDYADLNCLPPLLPTFSWGPSFKKFEQETRIVAGESQQVYLGTLRSTDSQKPEQQPEAFQTVTEFSDVEASELANPATLTKPWEPVEVFKESYELRQSETITEQSGSTSRVTNNLEIFIGTQYVGRGDDQSDLSNAPSKEGLGEKQSIAGYRDGVQNESPPTISWGSAGKMLNNQSMAAVVQELEGEEIEVPVSHVDEGIVQSLLPSFYSTNGEVVKENLQGTSSDTEILEALVQVEDQKLEQLAPVEEDFVNVERIFKEHPTSSRATERPSGYEQNEATGPSSVYQLFSAEIQSYAENLQEVKDQSLYRASGAEKVDLLGPRKFAEKTECSCLPIVWPAFSWGPSLTKTSDQALNQDGMTVILGSEGLLSKTKVSLEGSEASRLLTQADNLQVLKGYGVEKSVEETGGEPRSSSAVQEGNLQPTNILEEDKDISRSSEHSSTSVSIIQTHETVQFSEPDFAGSSPLESSKSKVVLSAPVSRRETPCSCLPKIHPYFWSLLYRGYTPEAESAHLLDARTKLEDLRTPLLHDPVKGILLRAEEEQSDMTSTIVTIDRDETSIRVESDSGASAVDRAVHIAEDLGLVMRPHYTSLTGLEVIKSVVYGGLDVSMVSLGVVASAAGGDAKTGTVVAIGLANLMVGIVTFFHRIVNLHTNNRTEFAENVGRSLWLNGGLAFFSFLIFGCLAPVTYALSFRHNPDRDFKFMFTTLISLLAVILLGAGKAHVTFKPYIKTISSLVLLGFTASIAGYYTGEFVSRMLAKLGIDEG